MLLEQLVARAKALGYRALTQTGSISLEKPGEDPRIFYYLQDAEAYLDRRHLAPSQRIRKAIAREAEQLGRIINNQAALLAQFYQYWSERCSFIPEQLITEAEAQQIFQAHYCEGINQCNALRLKVAQQQTQQMAKLLVLPPGYTLDASRGDGWIYPQYFGRDIPRTPDWKQVYRFRTADGARQFVTKASKKLVSILPTAIQPIPQRPRLVTQRLG